MSLSHDYTFTATTPVYIEAEVQFDQTFYDEGAPITRTILNLLDEFESPLMDVRLRSGTPRWNPSEYSDVAAHIEFGTWHTVKLGWAADGVFEVDGTDSGGPAPSDPSTPAMIFQLFRSGSVGTVRARNVKVGSTFGASDILDAPDEVILPEPPAEPPPNDDFANAQSLTGSSGTVQGTTIGATTEALETATHGPDTVWYSLTAPFDGWLVLETSDPAAGVAIVDSVLELLTGAAVDALTQEAINDNAGINGSYSRIVAPVTEGTVYHVRVSATDPLFSGGFSLAYAWSLTEPDPPWPNLISASADEDSGLVILGFDRLLNNADEPDVSAFTVTCIGNELTVVSLEIITTFVFLTLADIPEFGTILVSYDPPITNPLRNFADDEAPAFTNQVARLGPSATVVANRFYEAPPWRFVVTDLDHRIITWLDHLAYDRSVTFTRGQPTVIACGVPSDNPEINLEDADSNDPLVHEGTRVLHAFRRDGTDPPWRIKAAGPLLDVQDVGTTDVGTTRLAGYDSRQVLRRRPVLGADNQLPSGTLGLVRSGIPGNEILIEQLDLMLANSDGPLPHAGLDWGQTAFYEGTIETTEALDEITFARGSMIAEMMDALEQTGTLDLVIRAIWDPVNRPGIFGELSILERAGGPRYNAVFGWDMWPRTLVGIDRLTDGKERVNTVQFYTGQGGPPVVPYDDAASIAKYGDAFAQQFFPGQVSQPAVEAMARRVLALAKNGVKTYRLSPAAERAAIPLTEYRVFDTVRGVASRRLREPLNEFLRVESLPILIGDDQLERVSQLLVAVDDAYEAGS